MLNLFLFLAVAFLFTLTIGKLIEKINVPWIFAALILGSLLAIQNPFASITSSPEFIFASQLGMYLLLFVIGFELDLTELKKLSGFIIKSVFFIILTEALFGTLLVHFVFGCSWLISFVVSLSFATVGEAVLIPILDKFKIVNTKLGQSIIGIGTLDDIVELGTLIFVIILVGSKASASHLNIALILISLFVLFILAYIIVKFKEKFRKLNFVSAEYLFLIVLFVLFLFLGIGEYAHAAAIAALLSGLSLKAMIPEKWFKTINGIVRAICYSLFAPLFFLWVGVSMDINYLISYPLLVILVVLVSMGAKILGSFIMGRKELGIKKSVLLGIGLSVRFSTSIIVLTILFKNKLIGVDLYSVIIASTILFTFIIPILFSNLLARWKIKVSKTT